MIVYGPVPSRRLGQSLGVNNIPPKICSYSCVYCQIGRTNKMRTVRSEFYKPEDVYSEAEFKVNQLKANGEFVDYISFVPDGEPTLDKNLGLEIELLKKLNIKIAVITNASLLWMDEVKADLMKADLVSVKIDAADKDTWRKIDRPHGSLKLQKILDGIYDFAKSYKGTLVTETMLVADINDYPLYLESIGRQIERIRPQKAYLLVPTRPPAEKNIYRVGSKCLAEAVSIISSISGVSVECITGDENKEGFFFTDDIADDLLSITSVHPIREDIINHLLKIKKADYIVLQELIRQNKIIEYTYEGRKFYKKNLDNNSDK